MRKKQGIDGRGTPAVRDSLVAFTSLFIAICCESPRARDVLPGAALLSLSTPPGITYWGIYDIAVRTVQTRTAQRRVYFNWREPLIIQSTIISLPPAPF